jgi:hypothetical protein
MPEINLNDFTPQVLRILALSAIENRRGASSQDGKIAVEQFIIAAAQDGENFLSVLLANCNLTISDLRNGIFQPRLIPETKS